MAEKLIDHEGIEASNFLVGKNETSPRNDGGYDQYRTLRDLAARPANKYREETVQQYEYANSSPDMEGLKAEIVKMHGVDANQSMGPEKYVYVLKISGIPENPIVAEQVKRSVRDGFFIFDNKRGAEDWMISQGNKIMEKVRQVEASNLRKSHEASAMGDIREQLK